MAIFVWLLSIQIQVNKYNIDLNPISFINTLYISSDTSLKTVSNIIEYEILEHLFWFYSKSIVLVVVSIWMIIL